MRRSSLYISATVHALLLLLAILGLPFIKHKELDVPQPITVELVDVSQITQTNKPAPPQPKPPEPAKPQPAPPPPTPTPPTPPAPTPEPPKPEPKVEKPAPVIDENAPPKKEEKKVVKKQPPKKAAAPKDFSSVLKTLDVNNKPPPPTPEPAQQAPIGEKLTVSEEDALKSQLMQCWNVPIGAKDVQDVVVTVVMTINQDRTLKEAHIEDTSRYNSDPVYQALADSALRAVHNPNCSPFAVPPDKYDTWNHTKINFNPKDMFQ
jgi:outer membrane biosynthesis protein TonB